MKPQPLARLRSSGRPRRRTARLRLAALYGSLFLLSGAALVSITYVLFERATKYSSPQLPQVPHTPAIQKVQITLPLAKAAYQLTQAQQELTQAQKQLPPPGQLAATGPASGIREQLAHEQRQLTQDQHQLARVASKLTRAVHQVTQAGSAQTAQRAVDSHQLLVNSGIALAIVAILALLATWLLAGRVLRPIRTITRAARSISSSSLHERLSLDGPHDELKELGDTLDDLFGRLAAAFDAQRHFVANASHELRTPLTVERNLLQVALDDPDTSAATWRFTANELLECNDEQGRLIEALLTLASGESGLHEPELVDLASAVMTALVDLQPEIGRLGIHVHEVTALTLVDGDPLLVERLVGNLLANAVHHNREHGHIEVVTEVKLGMAVVSVSNTGAIIPSDEIDRLFQPFQRLDRRRVNHQGGHGLGLSIVRAIARAHHATLVAQPRPGGGLSVSVVFPLADNSRAGSG